MAEKKKIAVQTKWQGVWGQAVRMPNGHSYTCSASGEMDVCEDCARELTSSAGWRHKPVEQKRAPVAPAKAPPPAQPPAPPPQAPAPAPAAKKSEADEAGFVE